VLTPAVAFPPSAPMKLKYSRVSVVIVGRVSIAASMRKSIPTMDVVFNKNREEDISQSDCF
jgi:hypothetical protein